MQSYDKVHLVLQQDEAERLDLVKLSLWLFSFSLFFFLSSPCYDYYVVTKHTQTPYGLQQAAMLQRDAESLDKAKGSFLFGFSGFFFLLFFFLSHLFFPFYLFLLFPYYDYYVATKHAQPPSGLIKDTTDGR